MTKKKRSKKDQQIEFLETQLANNSAAILQGPNKKKWTLHDLRNIKAITTPQELMVRSFSEGNHIVATGSAGTGKSLISLYLALSDILNKESPRDTIKIVRSIVMQRDVGHLPGSYEEKMAPYETPYIDIMDFLLTKNNSYNNLKDAGIIEFIPTSIIRGLTWDASVIVIDEMQNFTEQEIISVITRTGRDSKIIAIGDSLQNDLYRSKYDQSGFPKFLEIAKTMKEFDIINFTKADIVRHGIVRSFLTAYEDYHQQP